MVTKTQNLTEQRVTELAIHVCNQVIEAHKKGKQVLSLDEIRQKLQALPEEIDRDYEKALTAFATDWDDDVIQKTVTDLFADLTDGAQQSPEEDKIAFAAYGVVINYERRMKNSGNEELLLKKYRKVFEPGHVFFKHLYLLNQMEKLENYKKGEWDAFGIENLLKFAKENADNLTKNAGGAHAFAETVALAYEQAPEIMETLKKSDADTWLKLARETVERAINDDPNYAKFYLTKARLIAITGNYDSALNLVKDAIDKEDNKKTDYAIRIGNYQTYLQQFRAKRQLEAVAQENLAEYKAELEKQEKQTIVKNMEFLGLFSGIVSFTIGSLTISGAIAEQSIKNAAGLIVVLMGALMSVFASFGVILHGFQGLKALRNLLVLLLGLGAVIGGILFCLS